MSKKEENKYDFTQTIVTKIISEQDKLAMSLINEYCKKKNIIPNIISEEKLKAVLDLGMARKTKIDVLQSQLDIANKKLEEMKKSQLETLNETRKYLNSKKVTPEMVAIALRKIEISILGVDTDE